MCNCFSAFVASCERALCLIMTIIIIMINNNNGYLLQHTTVSGKTTAMVQQLFSNLKLSQILNSNYSIFAYYRYDLTKSILRTVPLCMWISHDDTVDNLAPSFKVLPQRFFTGLKMKPADKQFPILFRVPVAPITTTIL